MHPLSLWQGLSEFNGVDTQVISTESGFADDTKCEVQLVYLILLVYSFVYLCLLFSICDSSNVTNVPTPMSNLEYRFYSIRIDNPKKLACSR